MEWSRVPPEKPGQYYVSPWTVTSHVPVLVNVRFVEGKAFFDGVPLHQLYGYHDVICFYGPVEGVPPLPDRISNSSEDICVWADKTWCYGHELHTMTHMSDDYFRYKYGSLLYFKFCASEDLNDHIPESIRHVLEWENTKVARNLEWFENLQRGNDE